MHYPSFESNPYFLRDIFNVIIGVVWQISLVILPIALVTHEFGLLYGVIASFVATSAILKFTWWNKLDDMSKDTLPVDFDERVKRMAPNNGKPSTDVAAEESVIYSK